MRLSRRRCRQEETPPAGGGSTSAAGGTPGGGGDAPCPRRRHEPGSPAREGFVVAVAGNPNSGKTTLFNALTGAAAKVGNYPGITVDSRTGRLDLPRAGRVTLVDVPGTYSLTARSADEEVAINALLGRKGHLRPDAVVVVLDATSLERNLYFLMQVLEFDLPVVAAVNMLDAARAEGIEIRFDELRRIFKVPFVGIVARKRQGIDLLTETLEEVLLDPAAHAGPGWLWDPPPALAADLDSCEPLIRQEVHFPLPTPGSRRAFALWLLSSLTPDGELVVRPRLREHVLALQRKIQAEGRDLADESIALRYAFIDRITPRIMVRRTAHASSVTERIDGVLTHPLWGTLVFLAIMGVVFQALFSWSEPLIGLIERLMGGLGGWLAAVLPAGFLRDLLVEGIVGGVGSVVTFLPQIVFLFLFVALLEGSGYLARSAFLIDRLMRRIGLHGQAFVPMLSGFACAVPAIMATRTIESRRDRLLTMMVVPLISCSARLPVYTLIIALLFPTSRRVGPLSLGTVILLGIYVVSTLLALLAASVLSRTLFRGRPQSMILELPPYRLPDPKSVWLLVVERSRAFLTTAGTIILTISVVLWVLLSHPVVTPPPAAAAPAGAPAVLLADGQVRTAAGDTLPLPTYRLRYSYAGRLGTLIEPVLQPLGFDWKIGVGLIGAFAAREVFISTMGVVYGAAGDEHGLSLRQAMRAERRPDGRLLWTPLTGIALLAFFMIALQCMSTFAVIRRESGGWGWAVFALVYLNTLAYLVTLAIYQGGRLLGLP